MSCEQQVAHQLRQVGLRITPQRLMVIDVVLHHDGHLTAEEIHARIQEQYPYVDLSTVYRTLQVLIEQELVTELHVPDGSTQYEALGEHRHHHAICRRCGAMVEIAPEILRPVREALRATHGFDADLTHMAIFGTCRACAENES